MGTPHPIAALLVSRHMTRTSNRASAIHHSATTHGAFLILQILPPYEIVCSLMELPVPSEDVVAIVAQLQSPEEAEQRREVRFLLDIVSLYNYTCALTGHPLDTIASGSIIDAAHIHRFADSRNNDIRNGLALCKNAHWLFDNGLWDDHDDYTVKVALGRYTEASPDQKRLSDYHGQMIRLPSNTEFSPDPVHLDWHRKNTFLGSTDLRAQSVASFGQDQQ